jgi:hypothetical protein
VNTADLEQAVARRFGYLVDEAGFAGPYTSDQGYVGYGAYPWSVWVVRLVVRAGLRAEAVGFAGAGRAPTVSPAAKPASGAGWRRVE